MHPGFSLTTRPEHSPSPSGLFGEYLPHSGYAKDVVRGSHYRDQEVGNDCREPGLGDCDLTNILRRDLYLRCSGEVRDQVFQLGPILAGHEVSIGGNHITGGDSAGPQAKYPAALINLFVRIRHELTSSELWLLAIPNAPRLGSH